MQGPTVLAITQNNTTINHKSRQTDSLGLLAEDNRREPMLLGHIVVCQK